MHKYLIEVVSLDDTDLILDAKLVEEKDYVDACDEGCDFCDAYAENHGLDSATVDYYVFEETDDNFEEEYESCKDVITIASELFKVEGTL